MKTGKSEMEHMSDGMLQVYNRLLRRFIKYENQDDTSQSTLDYLSKLGQSIGYSVQVNAAVHKSFKLENRMKRIEDALKKKESFKIMQIFNDPDEIKARYK